MRNVGKLLRKQYYPKPITNTMVNSANNPHAIIGRSYAAKCRPT